MLAMHSTAAVKDGDCFDQWHDVTCRNYSLSECRRTSDRPFRGVLTSRAFGALALSEGCSLAPDQIRLSRTPEESARISGTTSCSISCCVERSG